MEDSVRLDVENRICDEHGPRADSFLRPQLVAFHTMNEVILCYYIIGGNFSTCQILHYAFYFYKLQLYYPSFKESTVYLRFLDELLTTLKKEDERAQAAPSPTAHENSPDIRSETGLSLSEQNQVPSFAAFILGRDLDDIDSLYSRPCFL